MHKCIVVVLAQSKEILEYVKNKQLEPHFKWILVLYFPTPNTEYLYGECMRPPGIPILCNVRSSYSGLGPDGSELKRPSEDRAAPPSDRPVATTCTVLTAVNAG